MDNRNMGDRKEGKLEEQDAKGKKKSDKDIDREVEQSFPASDPPSYSQPGNDKKAD